MIAQKKQVSVLWEKSFYFLQDYMFPDLSRFRTCRAREGTVVLASVISSSVVGGAV